MFNFFNIKNERATMGYCCGGEVACCHGGGVRGWLLLWVYRIMVVGVFHGG